jgi:four helix bundle protein
MQKPEEDNLIVSLSFQFALLIIEFAEELEQMRKFVVGNQLLKSGTSIGANIKEAQSAESRADFIHKLKIASKEAEETEYWLMLCKHSKNYPNADILLEKVVQIKKVLSKIIFSSKKNS